MKRILRIAQTEVLEHRRQPAMIWILAVNYALWILIFGIPFVLLNALTRDPETLAQLQQQLSGFGTSLEAFLRGATFGFGSLTFTSLPLFVAIISGTSVLHDRECGTMPFLMLAPITRLQLLLGKLAGAMAIPLALHLVFVGVSNLLFGRLEVLALFAYKFGGSPAWWVAFLFGVPASAMLVGALGTVFSALSADVRTSMQFTSFFIGLLGLGFGVVLVEGLTQGPLVQLGFALACLVAAGLTLLIGARLISRDVT